jgi:TRAP transporter TAXI family solute receptor
MRIATMLWLWITAAVIALGACRALPAPDPGPHSLATGAKGGGFHLYGNAVTQAFGADAPVRLVVRETAGSNENIQLLQSGAAKIALVNLGPAYEAWNGTASFAPGVRYDRLRALAPMYETPFHLIALRAGGITSIKALEGKRVGVGPAKGPGEVFFRGLIERLGVRCTLVNAAPDAHAKQLASGEIDAFWFGAGLPVPAFKQLSDSADAVVFGLTEDERSTFVAAFPYLAPYTIPAGMYRGQAAAIETAAVWNFVLAARDLDDATAYAITRSLLTRTDALARRYPAAAATRPENAPNNRFLPFHPGAQRFYNEHGIKLTTP